MKNTTMKIVPLFIAGVLLSACGQTRYPDSLIAADSLTYVNPDSALEILDGIDKCSLDDEEMARYALVYTIAQDKSGFDVDDDSLLYIAFDYYSDRPEDTLYGKCQYYMGKYYMLNDCTDKAVDCFKRAVTSSEKLDDKHTQYLALTKLSKALLQSDADGSIEFAKRAIDSYYALGDSTATYNLAYLKINLSQAYSFAGMFEEAEIECFKAIDIAMSADSCVLSDAYQMMSCVQKDLKQYSLALDYSKKSFEQGDKNNKSKQLNLATAYLDADSLTECRLIIESMDADDMLMEYTLYYMRYMLNLKMGNIDVAASFSDSAYSKLENIYAESLKEKTAYYAGLSEKQQKVEVLEKESTLQSWVFALSIILFLFIVTFIIYVFRLKKEKIDVQLRIETERRKVEEHLHGELIMRKEKQMAVLRNFISDKVDIAQKIENLKSNGCDTGLMSEKDWEDIRMFVDSMSDNFVERILERNPNLTVKDINFLLLVRLDLSAKTLSQIYGISEKSVKQKLFVYKARVGIEGEKTSLRDFIQAF